MISHGQGTRMQAKKISNFADFTSVETVETRFKTFKLFEIPLIMNEKTWVIVGQTYKTRICQSLLGASNSHSRHMFPSVCFSSMSGP